MAEELKAYRRLTYLRELQATLRSPRVKEYGWPATSEGILPPLRTIVSVFTEGTGEAV